MPAHLQVTDLENREVKGFRFLTIMKQSLLTVMKSFLMRNSRTAFNWQVIGNNNYVGIGLLLRVARLLAGGMTLCLVLLTVSFVRYCKHIRSHHGRKGLAQRLKASAMAIMKYVSKSPLQSTAALGAFVALTSGGLPTWLPVPVRRRIRENDPLMIRLVLTFCNLYRVIGYSGKLSVKTIVSPGPTLSMDKYLRFIAIFFRNLSSLPGANKINFHSLPSWKSLSLLKSAPGTSAKTMIQTSVSALLRHVSNLSGSHLRDTLLAVMAFSNGPVRLFRIFEGLSQIQGRFYPIFRRSITATDSLGRLGFKDEPGKVRVFAMVDWWTQMALRPLHILIFSILGIIPQDGTFDQSRLVNSIQERIRAKGSATGGSRTLNNQTSSIHCMVYSFDLSAATDRLPVELQAAIVNWLIPGLGPLWRKLLVDRVYHCGRRVDGSSRYSVSGVRYAVGQPMGALSSWAMLALTHHFMVQLAANRAGLTGWFMDYGVLGDDLVIIDSAVASAYLEVARELGVDINLHKSLVSSNGHFEFAKRFCSPFTNLSGVSLAEVTVAGGSLAAFRELLQRFSIVPSVGLIANFMGKGPMAISHLSKPFNKLAKSSQGLLIWFLQPGFSKFSAPTWSKWFSITGLLRFSSKENWLGILRELRSYVYDRVPAHEELLEDMDLGSILFAEPFHDDDIFPSFPNVRDQDKVLIDSVNELFSEGLDPHGFTTSFPFWSLEGGRNDPHRVDQAVERINQFLGENTPMEEWFQDEESLYGAFAIRRESPERLSVGQWLHLWHRCQKVESTAPARKWTSVTDILFGDFEPDLDLPGSFTPFGVGDPPRPFGRVTSNSGRPLVDELLWGHFSPEGNSSVPYPPETGVRLEDPFWPESPSSVPSPSSEGQESDNSDGEESLDDSLFEPEE